jgi:hypothetical protein
MKSITDRQALARKATTANILSFGGMIILLAGVSIPTWAPQYADYSMGIVIFGFAIANIGIFLANRWVKRPRPEDVLDYVLRTRNNQHRIYHYLLPHDHVFLTPTGVVVLEVCALEGSFRYRNGKWHRKFSMTRMLRFFVEESLGDPIKQAQDGAKAIAELLSDVAPVPVDSMVVFISPHAEYEAEDPPIPVVQPEKLGKRLPQHDKLPPETLDKVREALDEAARVEARGLEED